MQCILNSFCFPVCAGTDERKSAKQKKDDHQRALESVGIRSGGGVSLELHRIASPVVTLRLSRASGTKTKVAEDYYRTRWVESILLSPLNTVSRFVSFLYWLGALWRVSRDGEI